LRTTPSPHTQLFWEYQGQTAIRRGEWKLMLGPKEGLGENAVAPKWLSNLKEDAAEKRNWLDRETQVAAALETRLAETSKQLIRR
jgi:arylsulfatase A-like enzyme